MACGSPRGEGMHGGGSTVESEREHAGGGLVLWERRYRPPSAHDGFWHSGIQPCATRGRDACGVITGGAKPRAHDGLLDSYRGSTRLACVAAA